MAKHILSCSFGKDSIATALLALQHGEPLDELVYCEVMFSEEISGELPEHNRFIHETAIPYFEQRGIPTRVLRSEKTYLSCFYHVVTRGKTKGMLSGFPLSGRCTIQRDCKLPPIKAFEFEAKAQEEAERSLSGANKPFQEVAEEYIASAKAKLEPAALLRGNYDSDKNKANTTLNKVGYLKKIVSVAPWFAKKSVSEITREDCARVIEEIKEKGCLRSEYAFILPEYAAMKNKSFTKMVVGYDISAYTAMKCFSGAAVTRKTAEVVSNILGVSVRDAFRFERDERPLSKKTIREYVLFANQVLHFANERYHSVQAEFKMPAKGARPRFVDCIHEDEVCKLMSEIDKCSMPEQAIVLSLLNTGVRRAELAGLTWSDFDFKECTVHVNKSLLVFRDFGYQHTATKESNDRYIDVAPEYMEFMQQYKEWWYTKKRLMGASWQRDMVKNKESKRESLMRLAGEEFVIIDDFGWPRNPDGYNALVKRVAKKAGIKDIHPHMFRHTFVSLLMSNPDIGVATVAAEAGHAQPSTTLMIYTQQYKKRRESIRNQLSRELYEK